MRTCCYPFLCLVVAVCQACAGTPASGPSFEPSQVVLHLDYRSGGDAPVGFLLTFLEDGRLCYSSPRWKVYCAHLRPDDEAKLRELIESPPFRQGLEQLRAGRFPFACCDRHEVGIYLGADAKPAGLGFDGVETVPAAVKALVPLINRLGHEYFGRRYQMELPEE